MGLKVLTQPAVEPVTLDEAKLHCRVDSTSEDSLISSLIQAAREYVERYTRRALVYTTYRYTLDCFPGASTWSAFSSSEPLELPRQPVAEIAAAGNYSYAMPRVRYYDADSVQQTLTYAGEDFELDLGSNPPSLRLLPLTYWPIAEYYRANAVEIDFVAGYGPTGDAVPSALKTALLMLVAHWYENRAAVAPGFGSEVPLAVESLLKMYQVGDYQ
jgi:uncharacterized phiE125 gp8 family phage protein